MKIKNEKNLTKPRFQQISPNDTGMKISAYIKSSSYTAVISHSKDFIKVTCKETSLIGECEFKNMAHTGPIPSPPI